MALLPPMLYRNGAKGWIAFFATLPLFLIYFAMMLVLWVPLGIICCVVRALQCRCQLGHFITAGPLAIHIALALWIPVMPHGVIANFGKWGFAILLPVVYFIGRCYDGCKKRKSKASGINEEVPMHEDDCKEEKVSDNVTVVSARFREALESSCAMTVITGSDWVLFFNPVFAPLDIYKKYGEGKKRVILFLPTLAHHMAADLCLAAHPKAEIFGSEGAGLRHVPNLEVKHPAGLKLPGFQTFDVSATLYDEHWLFYEPAGLLLVGDFMPMIHNAMEMPRPVVDCTYACGRCCYKSSMLNYTKALVTNLEEVRPVITKVAQLPIQRIEGAHTRDDPNGKERPNAREEFVGMWCWVLPADWDDEKTERTTTPLMAAP